MSVWRRLDMNLKYILAAGVILFCCAVSTQTFAGKKAYNSAGVRAYNSSPPIAKGGMEARDTRVPRAEAVKRTLRAAEQGDASAQFKMALRYDSGQGVPQDRAESVKWLRKAAEQGESPLPARSRH
jgi:TPR repeat protein